jgi:GNAT superfamily N-acetyltransferase
MYNGIKTDIMGRGEAGEAFELWKKQFSFFCGDKALYPCWQDNFSPIENYITDKASQGMSIAAKRDGRLVGFISCDIFSFHGIISAICHFCGNASSIEERKSVYSAMYSEFCKFCVDRGALAQYISICANDTEVKNLLFDIGFGSYGADAFARFDKPLPYESGYEIKTADISDASAVFDLYLKESDYFLCSPVYLRLPACSLTLIEQKIMSGKIYVAKDRGVIIGMMDLEIAKDDNIYRMYTKGSAVVCGEIGAYIIDGFRGKGIGSRFMGVISDYCTQNNVRCAHVPWETANPYANRFWRKFFEPTVLALKRSLHPDILI